MRIRFTIDNPKLISVNEQYMHPVKKTKSGRYTSYVVKSPYLKEVQEYYNNLLNEIISDEDIKKLQEEVSDEKLTGLALEIRLGLPRKDIYENDMSNYIKAYEDCISRRLKIDDSRNLLVSIEEQLYESEDNRWKIITDISSRPIRRMEDKDGNID